MLTCFPYRLNLAEHDHDEHDDDDSDNDGGDDDDHDEISKPGLQLFVCKHVFHTS